MSVTSFASIDEIECSHNRFGSKTTFQKNLPPAT